MDLHTHPFGHDLPLISAPDRTSEGLLHSETCRVTYSSISTLAVNRPGGQFGQQCAGKPAFNGQSGSTAEIRLAVEKSPGAVPIDPLARNPHLTYDKMGEDILNQAELNFLSLKGMSWPS